MAWDGMVLHRMASVARGGTGWHQIASDGVDSMVLHRMALDGIGWHRWYGMAWDGMR